MAKHLIAELAEMEAKAGTNIPNNNYQTRKKRREQEKKARREAKGTVQSRS